MHKTPNMGNLPLCHVERPKGTFEVTGMNYFDLFTFIFTGNRSKVRRYGVLFTCLLMGAVHLKMARSLKTDLAIMAVQRVAANLF